MEKKVVFEFSRNDIHDLLKKEVEKEGYEINGTIIDEVSIRGTIGEGAIHQVRIEIDQ